VLFRSDYAEALDNRGNALLGLKRPEEALASYDQALTIQPDAAQTLCNRANALHGLNRFKESLVSYERALMLEPDLASARFGRCMAELPVLYADEHEIIRQRAAYERQLRALCGADERILNETIFADAVGTVQPFFLAYQGYNDRDLQALYGSFVCRAMAAQHPPVMLAQPALPGEAVRIGIVSGFFRAHSVWKIPVRGWISQIDRLKFRVFGYHTGIYRDSATDVAINLCERFVQGPLSIDHWREQIKHDAPHVLIYPEVGMDPVAGQLAAQRLAPVQCNSWGHPETSGYPTLDYFLTSDLMEPPEAQDHYTERLIRLPNLSIYYEPLGQSPISITRSEMGLRSTATVYWCGQSLFKYLPQFDNVFPRIAKAAGDCQFAFIRNKNDAVTEQFRRRLEQAFARVGMSAAAHCVFLPRLDQAQFVAAIGQCDIVLDSIGWSGCNTTMDGLEHNLPIVTMTGSLMRGRHTMAILEMMAVTETIAQTIEDYVAIAVRLANDIDLRANLRNKIAASKHRVYCDRECVAALEEFLDRVGRTGAKAQ
jgi:protein O-GlcNAc transferase